MSFVVAARNLMLDSLQISAISLHSGFPGSTGANELSGGGYAREACAFGAASGAVRTLSSVVNVAVGAGHEVRWVGLWAGSTFLGYSPNGGQPREFYIDPALDIVTYRSHGYADGDAVVFYGGTTPAPLVQGSVYYVRDATTDTFKVAATLGGAAVDLTTVGATDCVVSRIFEDTYAGGDTHTISSWSLGAVN